MNFNVFVEFTVNVNNWVKELKTLTTLKFYKDPCTITGKIEQITAINVNKDKQSIDTE